MTMQKYKNHKLGAALIDALGLPQHTISVDISLRAGGPFIVRCEYHPADMNETYAERLIAEFRQIEMERVHDIDAKFELLRKDIAVKTDLRGELALNEIHKMGTMALRSLRNGGLHEKH